MSRVYTDKELMIATQLAYCNWDSAYVKIEEDERKDFSVCGLLNTYTNPYEVYYNKDTIYYQGNNPSKIAMRDDIRKIINDGAEGEVGYSDWKIIDIRNLEHGCGMYAITIETEPGNAIIAFRGSEKVDGNFPPDWIYSDGGIATGKLTYQELMAVKYLDVIEKEYGDKYSSYAITGHSLGGDLALVSTMLTSNSQYVSSEISKKISQSVGFDAPGHPEEFIDKYADNINAMSDVMTHYQYSLVGEIFTSLCEETSRYYHVRADVCFPDISAIDLVMPGLREKQNLELLLAYVLKHSTAMLAFDSYDNLERIESIHRDGLSKFMDLASGLVDRKSTLQNIIGDVSNIYGSIQLMCRYIWKDGEYKSDYEANLNSIFLEDSIEDLKRTIWLETLDQYMKQVFGSGVFSLLGSTFLDFFINDDDAYAYDAATKTINGTDKQDTICGYRGNDIINGYDGNDVIYGGDGNDIVRGGKGDDVIIGGRGNDSLNGEAGSDTYIFTSGDGIDIVDTYAGTNDTWKGDKIKFNGVRAEDVEIQRKNNQLILVNKKTDDRITINAYYNDSWHGVGSIEFVDGTVWDHEYIGQYRLSYVGTDGNDILTGYDSGFNYNLSEIFYGRDGNDTIRAGKGDDILVGGKGNDNLTGGTGSDTYIFNIGDGNDLVDTYAGTNDTWKGDKIKLNDVKAEDVEIQRKNNQLILVNKKTDDRITINAYYNDSWHGVGNIKFADGTVWNHEYIGHYQLSYIGTDGNDTLTGYDTGFNYNTSEIFDGGNGNDTIRAGKGDDILIGGKGDDSLTGGAGSDTYIFNTGDGVDLVDTYAGTNDTWKGDKIKFNDVRAEDVEIQRKNNQLILVNKKTDDSITINAYYNDSWHGVGSVEFADGTVWDHEYICQYQLPYVGTDGNDTMTGFDSGFNYNLAEIFYGRDGNDTIRAGKGDDTLIGGRGDDSLTGGAGSDTYIFNIGDGADLVDTYAGTNDTWKGDKIRFNDVKAEDVEIQRKNNQLILVNKKTDDRITINAYYNDSWHGVGIIEFADGTTWDHDYLGQYQLSYFGTDGNDTLTGYDTGFNYNTSEIFNGGNGNDTIRAGKGDDILIGGRGDDSLTGGAGFDTYIFTSGDGIDIVDTYAGTNDTWKGDKIKLIDVKAEDVEIQRKNNQLILVNKKTDDRITINAYYNDSWHGIGTIEFADGTVWDHEYIGQYQLSYIGTDGNDTLTGYDTGFNYNTSEIFDGGNGNDTIRAGKGDDTLIGGRGDDSLTGGAGSDTYIFNIGDGNDLVDTYAGTNDTWKGDKIRFNDVKAEDVELQRKNNQLILVNKKTDDRITINAYYNDSWHGVGTIEFADGTTWDHDYIGQYQMTYTGTDGNDTLTGFDSGFNYNVSEIFDGGAGDDTIRAGKGDDVLTGGSGEDKLHGGAGNDILVGGAGNDYMEGGAGADIYYIYTGDGNDVIYNYDNTASRADDRLVFGSGIRAGAMSLSRNGNDLLITNTATSQVTTIRSGFSGEYYQLNNLEFDDATATIDYKETRLNIRYRTVTRVDDTILEDAVIVKDEDILIDNSDVIYETDVIREAETLTVINDTDILETSGNAIDTVIRENMTDRTGEDILVADILLEEPHDKEISEDNILTDSEGTVANEDVLREDILTVQSTYDDVTVDRTEQGDEKESIFTETLTEERTTEGTTEVAAEPVQSIDSIVEASINAMHEAADGDVPVQDGNNDTYETTDVSFASDGTSVDQIVEVMVQEMSEPSGSAVSDSETIRTEPDSTSTEQLWSE